MPKRTSQLLIVTSENWHADHGRLSRWQKEAGQWHRVGRSIPVVLGRNGMAWGRGIGGKIEGKGPIKREGDKRSPAGIFELPFLFGEGEADFRYPYRRMTRFSRCVDDPRSRAYNRIVDRRKVPADYRSAEKMKFPSGLYRYGIFVAHNPGRIPGAGSCIFLHIRKPDGAPTVGCTAMKQKDLVQVMRWLDPRRHPLLIQAPRTAIPPLLPGKIPLTKLR
ncbi:hypothetical protein [Nitratifractor sp.]|uniref:L,D-transpeptidase family protein n=1 Tax=Nitratifractor sp. TaxID=2268144 RepID=UPI002600FEF3|nr:hypothetical protein [Nitratifractor sp.]